MNPFAFGVMSCRLPESLKLTGVIELGETRANRGSLVIGHGFWRFCTTDNAKRSTTTNFSSYSPRSTPATSSSPNVSQNPTNFSSYNQGKDEPRRNDSRHRIVQPGGRHRIALQRAGSTSRIPGKMLRARILMMPTTSSYIGTLRSTAGGGAWSSTSKAAASSTGGDLASQLACQ